MIVRKKQGRVYSGNLLLEAQPLGCPSFWGRMSISHAIRVWGTLGTSKSAMQSGILCYKCKHFSNEFLAAFWLVLLPMKQQLSPTTDIR